MAVHAYGQVYNVLPSTGSPITATANSGAIYIPPERKADNLSVQLNFTTVTGTTPSLTANVQFSNDGVTFSDPDAGPEGFTAITAAKSTVKQFAVKGRYFRVVFTVTGTTPSFTGTATAFTN